MASVFDVAKYILERQGRMSTWKLQKLCYYAQSWALAWTEQELFPEEFEAWSNGSVCRELFKKHKGLFMVKISDLQYGNPDNLTPDEQDTVNIVLRNYGTMSPYELRELSHSEAPYREARQGLPDGVRCENIISKQSMGAFYGTL